MYAVWHDRIAKRVGYSGTALRGKSAAAVGRECRNRRRALHHMYRLTCGPAAAGPCKIGDGRNIPAAWICGRVERADPEVIECDHSGGLPHGKKNICAGWNIRYLQCRAGEVALRVGGCDCRVESEHQRHIFSRAKPVAAQRYGGKWGVAACGVGNAWSGSKSYRDGRKKQEQPYRRSRNGRPQ